LNSSLYNVIPISHETRKIPQIGACGKSGALDKHDPNCAMKWGGGGGGGGEGSTSMHVPSSGEETDFTSTMQGNYYGGRLL